ncbi:MAG TPA: protein translocase subunit SecF [Bacilli bacterium]
MSYEKIKKFDFMKHRKTFFTISIVITVLGIISLLVFNLNYGVDFKSGTTLDITTGKAFDKQQAESLLKEAGVTASVLTMGGNNERVTARFDRVLKDTETQAVIAKFKEKFGDQVTYEESTVDVEMARELARNAIYAVLLACGLIFAYIIIRFEWRFALGGIIALIHDAFIVISFFSIFHLEVNLPFIAAVLTIIGYSINDTIVIYDRVRENLRFAKLKSYRDIAEVVNKSVRQTMTRSINTVITVLVAAICLFAFGSPAIRLFSLAMIVGLVSGAYSSIFIASPIWASLKLGSLEARKRAVSAKS